LDNKVNTKAATEIINPNKNILGKIVLKNLLLLLLFNDAKTDGETTAEKKIIDPIKKDSKMLVRNIINVIYFDRR
tara:strand:- start:1151 stop:1375 length:225 start_codon:yes stop_codon:yes gene_type:complete